MERENNVRLAARAVIAVLKKGERSEETVNVYRRAYEGLYEFLGERDGASESGCIDFINSISGADIHALYEHTDNPCVKRLRRPLYLLLTMLEDGRIDITENLNRKERECPPCFQAVFDAYLEACRNKENADATILMKNKRIRVFLDHLAQNGVCDLSALSTRDLTGFLLRFNRHKRKTMALETGILRDFLAHLLDAGHLTKDLGASLPKQHLPRNESVPYLWSQDEVAALLSAIDRTSAIGKRDYALLLLTIRLGLRTNDVRCLEFSSLDWHRKAISIVQSKTKRLLELPLLDDVGWAIIDYTKNGRPKTSSPRIFVCHRYPFDCFGSSASLTSRLYKYARRAGIGFPEGRLHGMHSLRGALAEMMLEDGTPLPIISGTLGHTSSTTTAAYYLRLDVENLRVCTTDVEAALRPAI